jgi:hypothetical protein
MRLQKWTSVFIVLFGVLALSYAAQSFTTLNVRKYHGKSGITPLTVALDTNFASISSTSDVEYAGIVGTGRLAVQSTIAAGASNGHIIKNTYTGSSSGTQAGLTVKAYDTDTNTVHAGGEYAGIYVNVKSLSDPTAGGESALISAHNYGSGGSFEVIDYGVVLYGDLREAVKVTGGTSEYAFSCVDQTITIAEFEGQNAETLDNATDGSWTSSGTLASPEAEVDGKYAVVGGDATTGLMIQAASITSTSETIQTNTFATAFGVAPVCTVAYTEDPGSAEAPWIVSVSATEIVVTTIADKNYSYIAVGARP